MHAPLKLAANANVSQRQRVANAAEDMIAAMALRQPVNVPRQAPAAAPVRTASIPSPAAQALARGGRHHRTAPGTRAVGRAGTAVRRLLTTAPMQAPVQAPVHAAPVQARTPIMAAALATHASYGQDDDEQDDDGFDMDDALPPIVVAPPPWRSLLPLRRRRTTKNSSSCAVSWR